jgi:opacity protein-like surface antigen
MSSRRAGVLGVCLAAAFLACGGSAAAQTLYLGVEGGWTSLQNQTNKATGYFPSTAKFDSGFAVGGRVGYEMGPWRFEEEYAYRGNDISSLANGGIPVLGASGSRQSHAFMTNLLYDISLGWPVTPHIGIGIGAANLIDKASAPGFGTLRDDSDWQFGYQAIGGIRYNLTPNFAFDVDYRYFATTRASFRVPGTTVRERSGYETHNVIASLVYRWGTPPIVPPAPPPAALPPPPPPPAIEPRGERG